MSLSVISEPIQVGSIYSRQQVVESLKWGRKAWTSAIKKGLKVHKHGNRYFISGSELIRFIESLDMQGAPTK